MKKSYLFTLLLSVSFLISVNAQSVSHWETVVYNNDSRKYFIGTSEPDPGWRLLSFNDVTWAEGPGGFGYGDNDHEAAMYRGRQPELFQIDKKKLNICLLQGENILAVQVHNSSSTSSDMTSNVFLSCGITNTSNNLRLF